MERDSLLLRELKIEVTQKCILNCLHCSSEANYSKSRELSKDKVLRTITEAQGLGAREVTFSGGEPLLWQPLSDIITHCKAIGIRPIVYTTGLEFNKAPILLDQVINAGLKSVVVSLFGATEETHEYITRTSGSFRGTLEAINKLISAGLDVKVHFVAMAPNWKQLKPLAELVAGMGVSGISVLRFVPHGRGTLVKDVFNLSRAELAGLKSDIQKIRSEKGIAIRVGSPFNILYLNEDVLCLAATDRAIIGSDERIFPCDAFKNITGEGQFNSLLEGSLADIWYTSDYLNFVRQELSSGLGSTCGKCSVRTACKGGCLAQKILRYENGKANLPDPDCLMQGGGIV